MAAFFSHNERVDIIYCIVGINEKVLILATLSKVSIVSSEQGTVHSAQNPFGMKHVCTENIFVSILEKN